ncbi:MAG: 3'(2'),5'-bisphosphate nucleotidase [Planctomycetota bacterium]|nr:MAG: 3'(2'),5'-bisphosphate nucleotidase [Planctomycetota bacterium]
MSNLFQTELEAALQAVRVASVACRAVQKSVSPETIAKQDKSPVTVADYASQAIVCKILGDAFPNDPIVGEEDALELRAGEHASQLDRIVGEVAAAGITGKPDEVCDWIDRGHHTGGTSRFWTLDPIDGTKGFLRNEQYAVSLALIIDGQIEVSVLACPNLPAADAWDSELGALFSAIRGHGAQLRSLSNSQSTPQVVRVSGTARGSMARFCESVESGHNAQDVTGKIRQILRSEAPPRRLDSQAKYGVVARGEADLYLRMPTKATYQEKIWDHAGGVLIVEEAGGRVTDMHGGKLDFSVGRELTRNRGVVVTNGLLHGEVLAAIREATHGPT